MQLIWAATAKAGHVDTMSGNAADATGRAKVLMVISGVPPGSAELA